MAIEVNSTTWWLEPRDPLVFGDGGRSPALAPQAGAYLPPQATAAGMVRTALLEAGGEITKDAAQRALAVSIRGPWLARQLSVGEEPELWLPAPADVALSGKTPLRGELCRPDTGEGTLWPEPELDKLRLVSLPDRDPESGRKTDRPAFPFWPYGAVVAWALRDEAETCRLLRAAGLLGVEKKRRSQPPIAAENRVHVAIENDTFTAKPEALFSSRGLRFDDGFVLALEVGVPSEAGLVDPTKLAPALRVLGGEARTVRSVVQAGGILPSFDSVAERLEACARKIAQDGKLGLRVQLITPGVGDGWKLPWPGVLANKLAAIAMDRFTAVSGWDLQKRGPRAVRRLVPAGSVFFFGPFASVAETMALARELWGRPLPSSSPATTESFLASPAADGFGITLAFPCSLSPKTL